MNIVFVSNYYNHHQSALSESLFRETNGNYIFIQTMPMESERKNMGWGEMLPEYVKTSYKNDIEYKECVKIINDADVVIAGSAPEKMIRERIRANKLTFRYSERIYKNKIKLLQLPLRFLKYHWDNAPDKNVYMLCASAYAAGDYAKTGNFIDKTYKWGYFPKIKKYDNIEKLIEDKEPVSILWVARLIELKHPEASIQVAKRLKDEGYNFTLKIIGNGALEEKLKTMIKTEGLEDYVKMLGVMKPEEVRQYMERSQIFLFTSDYNEGWGAVMNESMNSGCAVVASHAIGSVPFLVENGENGLIYKNGDIEDLYQKTKKLLDDQELRVRIGKNAYESMLNMWNADVAAKRFVKCSSKLLQGEQIDDVYLSGPCSKAE